MIRKKILISVPPSLSARWNKVCKKHNLSKSQMIEEYLLGVIPILEEELPNKMIAKAMKKMSEEIDTTATLFDTLSAETASAFDDDVENYKKMKRG